MKEKTTLDDIIKEIKNFIDEREWQKYHNNKDVAISIVIESAELLEKFQWKNEEEIKQVLKEKKDEISEEVADIFIYLVELANNLSIDLIEATKSKIEKNKSKYPLEKTKGKYRKYTEL